jgi:hypothetical protein
MMAHQEACQLYIEQQIKEGLAQGKTPHSIGKELTIMIKRMFETSIPAETLRTRARKAQKTEGIQPPGQMTTPPNLSNSFRNPGKSSCTFSNPYKSYLETPENQVAPPVVEHGGVREGAGQPAKYKPSSSL